MSGPKSSDFHLQQQLAAALKNYRNTCAVLLSELEEIEKDYSRKCTELKADSGCTLKLNRLKAAESEAAESLRHLASQPVPSSYDALNAGNAQLKSGLEKYKALYKEQSSEIMEEFGRLREARIRLGKVSIDISPPEAAHVEEQPETRESLSKEDVIRKAQALLDHEYVDWTSKDELRYYINVLADPSASSGREAFYVDELYTSCCNAEACEDSNRSAYIKYKESVLSLNLELRDDNEAEEPIIAFEDLSRHQMAEYVKAFDAQAEHRRQSRYISEKISEIWNRLYPQQLNSCIRLEQSSGTHYISRIGDTSDALDVFYSDRDREHIMWRVVGLSEGTEAGFTQGNAEESLMAQRQLCNIHPRLISELNKEGVILNTYSAPPPDEKYAVNFCSPGISVSAEKQHRQRRNIDETDEKEFFYT